MEPDDKLVHLDDNRLRPSSGPPAGVPTLYSAAAEAQEVHLRDYLRVLHKYRLTILLFVLVTVLTVAVVSLRLPKQYEAVVRLAIDQQSLSTLEKENPVPMDFWGFQDYLRTQVRVLQSDTLAAQTIRTLRLDREPRFTGSPQDQAAASGAVPYERPLDPARESELIRTFLGNLRVTSVPNSWLVEVRFYNGDAGLAARVANAHANNFIEHNFRTRYESTMRASEWLSDQLRELRAKMEKADEELLDFERAYNLVSIDDRQNVLTQRLSDLNHELSVVEADRVARESRYRQAESGEDVSLQQDPLVDKLGQTLADLRTQHAESRPQFGPQHPRMLRLEEQMAAVEAQIAAQQRAILAKLRSDYEGALKREKLLRGLVEQQKEEVNRLNQRLIQYNILKREATSNKRLYEGLLQQLNEAGISAGLRSSNIRVVDTARVPLNPHSPNVFLNVFLALCLSVPVGIALAFFREYLDNSIKTPDEVERYSALPTLAMVPLASTVAGGHYLKALQGGHSDDTTMALVTHQQPQSGMAESFRSLRTSVLLSFPERPPRLLLVTSGQPVDGKTSTSINLAVALAQRGGKVVLIDADLRKPSVHKFLQTDGSPGLSLYLSGSHDRSGLVVPTAVPNLFILPAGPVPPNPAELLSTGRMRELLQELAREYDHVVLDSPPVLSVTDSTILSVLVDGVILVVRSGKTTREVLRHTRQLFYNVNARLLGVVLNGVDLRSVDYNYYYYKYYGYGYREEKSR